MCLSGVRDVVSDNGFLCDYGDIDSISAKIFELVSNNKLRNNMSARSREIALKNFSKEKMVENYDSYFQRFIESNN
jgi:glycosyltransferase involved in cell wall biosynthesis